MSKTIETIQTELTKIAADKKARIQRFHEELDKMYEVKRADIKALRTKEAELLAELKALRATKPEAKAAKPGAKPAAKKTAPKAKKPEAKSEVKAA